MPGTGWRAGGLRQPGHRAFDHVTRAIQHKPSDCAKFAVSGRRITLEPLRTPTRCRRSSRLRRTARGDRSSAARGSPARAAEGPAWLLHFLRLNLRQRDFGLLRRRRRLLHPLHRLLFDLGRLRRRGLGLLHGRPDGDVLVLDLGRTAFDRRQRARRWREGWSVLPVCGHTTTQPLPRSPRVPSRLSRRPRSSGKARSFPADAARKHSLFGRRRFQPDQSELEISGITQAVHHLHERAIAEVLSARTNIVCRPC